MPIIGIIVACVTYITGYDTMILFIIITLIDLNEDNDVHVQQQQPLRKWVFEMIHVSLIASVIHFTIRDSYL